MRVSIITVACLLMLLLLVSCNDNEGREVTEPPPVLVEVLDLSESSESIRRRFVGFLHPGETHQVGFLTGGRVRDVRPSVGDEVRAGELIATLATDDHSIYVDLASIQKEAIEPNLERVRSLVERNILPQSQLDELEAKYQGALTQQRQADLKLSQTRLTSPVSGVVMMRLASRGQVIGPGMPVVILLEVDRLKARFGVTQRDLFRFRKGEEVNIKVQGLEESRPGRVTAIDVVPDAKTRTYGVTVELDNEDRILRPGMICHLEMVIREIEGIFIPLTSLSKARDGSFQVKLLDETGSRVESRNVSKGERIGEMVKIEEGLFPGDRILIRGQTFVREGDRVLVK